VKSGVPFLDVGFTNQVVASELAAAFKRVSESSYFILGPEVENFEVELAHLEGVDHSVGVGNGLDALALVLRALGIGPGDEVIVPSQTFIATWLAVSQVGATPVPVEIRDDTYNLDPTRIAEKVGPRTAAIVPVHLYGQPAEMEPIRSIADRSGLAVVADGAQSIGARYLDEPVGRFADATTLSFYPGKNLGALGDGGAILTSDAELADRLRRLRNYGSSQKYVHAEMGVNSRLDELQAAFLRAKLPHLLSWNARRQEIATIYSAAFAECDLGIPEQIPEAQSAWHLYVVRHPRRDDLQRHLAAAGVATLIHYPYPPHLQGAYAAAEVPRQDIAEAQAREILSLPIGPAMSDEQVHRVFAAVRQWAAAG
jgi:dTDP-4-amino-4,6-dideoxygalactose transaminase